MSTIATDKVDIQYLKQDNIGKVIAKGLAVLYQEQPKFPVDFLAKWLLNYSVSVNNENRLDSTLKEKEELKREFVQEQEAVEKENQIAEEANLEEAQIETNFQEKIAQEEYHDVLLAQEFPNFLESRKGLTGVYIGVKDFGVKEINEEEEDEKAHLETDQEKIINYIGFSNSHEELMRGKTLSAKEEESITAAVFKEQEPPSGEEDAPVLPTYVYVPDLIKEPRITYFRLPKLGAYIAYPLKYKSYLKEEFFNDALTKRQEFAVEHEKWVNERQEKENDFKKELEGLENDEEALAAKQAEFEQILSELPEEPREAEFLYEVREYVVCADTMGQDRGISAEDIAYLESYVKLFAESWERMERKLLSDDIDRQLAYLKDVPKERLDQLNDEEEKAEEDKKPEVDNLKDTNEKEYQYRLDSARLEKQKDLLREDDIQKYIMSLTQNRILKFPAIFQNVLYLLGHTIEEINLPGTHVLNWKYVKNLINEAFLNRVVEYTHQGPKPDPVKPYALVNRISAKMEKINMQEVEDYNIGYARLFKWIIDTARLRKTDIEVRRQAIADRLTDIEKKEQELEAWENDKVTKLQEAKENAEDPEAFVEEEWLKTFEEENAKPIVPEPAEAEVDEDCQFDQ